VGHAGGLAPGGVESGHRAFPTEGEVLFLQKEKPMRYRNLPRHAIQFDLFPSVHQGPLLGPDWQRLPTEVREKVTRLMTRMLSEHRARAQSERVSGGWDDE
jgi:hypothetical protein